MGTYTRTPRGPASHAVALNRGGRRIAVFYPEATDDEVQACLDTLTDRADHGSPREGFVHVSHGPVKPPYGTPEREAYDAASDGVEVG